MRIIVVSLALACAPGAAAQEAPAPSQQRDPPAFRVEIVVTAERAPQDRDTLPVATSVVDRDKLRSWPAPTLAHAVQSLPGFQLLSDGASGLTPASVARGFFGGGEAEYVTVLVDGVPLGDVESGVVDWRSVPAFTIERIEALRGPASALYGDTALGGVVQVFTVAPPSRALRIQASGGNVGSGTAGFAFSQPVRAVSIQAFSSYHTAEGFRAASAMREGFGSVVLDHSASSRRVTARASLNVSNRQDPGPLSQEQLTTERTMSDPLFRFDRDITRRGHAAVRYGVVTGQLTSSILGRVSERTGDRRRTLLLAPGFGDRADRDISSGGAGVSLENALEGTLIGRGSGHVMFGVDAARDRFDTAYFAVSNAGATNGPTGAIESARWRLAAYATQLLNIGERTRLHAGVRWDGLRDRTGDGARISHDAWSPRAGAVVSFGGGFTLFGQASRAFKAPTLEQLFDPRPFPDFSGRTFLISTPSLRPQRATNFEAGLRQSIGSVRWEAVAYRMRVRDEIDFDPRTFTYANIGRSRHDGVELDVSMFPNSPLAVGVNYAWTRTVPEGSNTQLKNIPRHLIRPGITVTLPGSSTVHARYTATAGAFTDDDNRVPLRNRSTLDVRAAKRFSRLRVHVDLLNVANAQYEEVGFVLPDFLGGLTPFFYPAPGFSATVGMAFQLWGSR